MRFLEIFVHAFATGKHLPWCLGTSDRCDARTVRLVDIARILPDPRNSAGAARFDQGTQLGLRWWRRASSNLEWGCSLPAKAPLGSEKDAGRLIADLQSKIFNLMKEKDFFIGQLQEKSALTRKDPLTGIFNRLAYEEQFQSEFQRWKRFGHPLTCLVWDIDHFKKINGQYGHPVGDEVLRGVAQQLSSCIRSTDFVARFGGEVFVMLLPGTDTRAALKVADKLRLNIAESKFANNGRGIAVTISCGLSGFEPGDSPESVFNRADHALYRAKQAGRNCCWLS